MSREHPQLAISRVDFESVLENQIVKGEELYNEFFQLKVNNLPFLNCLIEQYHGWNDYNSELLKQSFENPYNEYKEEYDRVGSLAVFLDKKKDLDYYLAIITDKKYNLLSLKAKVKCMPMVNQMDKENSYFANTQNRDQVLILNGNDETLGKEMEALMTQLQMVPINCNFQTKRLERLERRANEARFAVAIYSIEGMRKTSSSLRHKMIFEQGVLCALLGVDRVVSLIEDGVEKPIEIDDMTYIRLDSEEAWKYKLAKVMKKNGVVVDLNRIL